jgi:hypothetical protein
LGRGAVAPRRRARRAPRPPARAPATLSVRTGSPPDVPLLPRLTASLGYAPADAARTPQCVGVRTAPRAGAPRAPCRQDTPPFGPSVHPRPPARVRRTTVGYHAAVTPGRPAPYLNAAISPLCVPTEPPPSIAGAAGELAAPPAASAGRPAHSLP